MIKENAKQKKEIATSKAEAAHIKRERIKKVQKGDVIEQYGRRQNLEIAGIPEKSEEDTDAIVLEEAKLLKEEASPARIFSLYRLAKKPTGEFEMR